MSGANTLTPQLFTFLRGRRSEVFNQEDVTQLLKTLLLRVKKIKAQRRANESALANMEELNRMVSSKRMDEKRKAAYMAKNKDIVDKAKAVKAESLSPLDNLYLKVDTELALMYDRGHQMQEEAKEAAQKEKEEKKEEKKNRKREREEKREQEKVEKKEKRLKEREDRVKGDAELKAKQVGIIVDTKTALLKKNTETEEDVELDRKLKREALGVLVNIGKILPMMVGGNPGVRGGGEGKENHP